MPCWSRASFYLSFIITFPLSCSWWHWSSSTPTSSSLIPARQVRCAHCGSGTGNSWHAFSWEEPSLGSLKDVCLQAKMLHFPQAPWLFQFTDQANPDFTPLVQRFYGLWLQPSLFINYVQVKDLLLKAGIICSLSSVRKQLTWNTDKQWQPLLYMYYNTGNKTDQ